MWWGGFSEYSNYRILEGCEMVLIPMWWGGFSEAYLALRFNIIES